jgi:putative ABC transport system substrate-binding protein
MGLALLQRATRTVPIVFIIVSEPVAQGFVESLAHPGANITGFSNLEPSIAGKWLQLLKEIAPQVTHVAAMFNPDTSPFNVAFSSSAEAVARTLAVEAFLAPVRAPADIETTLSTLGRGPGGGLIVVNDTFNVANRGLIIEQTSRHRVPAIYSDRAYVEAGGLVSYGINQIDVWRQAAGYVDRILRGEQPASLPVVQPARFELVISLKTAKAIGLDISPALLSVADELLE